MPFLKKFLFANKSLSDSWWFSKPFRFDRNRNGGGILLFIREDILCKELTLHKHPDNIKEIFVEINLMRTEWLLFTTYHPPTQEDEYCFVHVGEQLNNFSQIYDKFLLIDDDQWWRDRTRAIAISTWS